MRKQLLASINLIDIFAYAFPVVEIKEKDMETFEVLRDDLKKLYSAVGKFQDLRAVNFTQQDYDKRLAECLLRKETLLANIVKYSYAQFLQSPVVDKLIDRPKDLLSEYFWGGVPSVPNLNNTGLENVGILAKGQIKVAQDFYEKTVKLEDIWLKKYHKSFHDFRKLLRGIRYVADSFAGIFSRDPVKDLARVDEAYDQFGDLNDEITEYQYYVDRGNQKEAELKLKEIKIMWPKLKDWLHKVEFLKLLQQLHNSIKVWLRNRLGRMHLPRIQKK